MNILKMIVEMKVENKNLFYIKYFIFNYKNNYKKLFFVFYF